MKLEWREEELFILELPIEQMGLLTLGVALCNEEKIVLETLLSGKKVRMLQSGLEYKQYRRTAPLGVYQKFVAHERALREMGICVSRDSH